jgi:hypothetical protein
MAVLAAIIAVAPAASSDASAVATAIDRAEAQALVGLVPEVRGSIVEGQKVVISDIDVVRFNASAYFGFYVSVPNEISSGIIGRYAVNKRTADLWDVTLGAWVCSSAIEAQLRKIRQKHHISVEVIKQYGDVPISPIEESAGNQVCREARPEAK